MTPDVFVIDVTVPEAIGFVPEDKLHCMALLAAAPEIWFPLNGAFGVMPYANSATTVEEAVMLESTTGAATKLMLVSAFGNGNASWTDDVCDANDTVGATIAGVVAVADSRDEPWLSTITLMGDGATATRGSAKFVHAITYNEFAAPLGRPLNL